MCRSPTTDRDNVLISTSPEIFINLLSQDFVVPNFLHLVRSYKEPRLSFVEVVCIKSYLLKQNPGSNRTVNDKFTFHHRIGLDAIYFHTNIDKLFSLGEYWKELYQG